MLMPSYSIAVCFVSGRVVVFDSHSHGDEGVWLALVPVEHFTEYFDYFWQNHYPHLNFYVHSGTFNSAHCTLRAV